MTEVGGGDSSNKNKNLEWTIPIGSGLDLKDQKPWAIQVLYDLFGWRTERNPDGTYDIYEEVLGPTKDEGE